MSFRYPAGLITANSPVNANYPSGVWTPQQAYPYIANNVWGDDPYFNQTVLLLHGDGTNGAQNNTFLDSSTNNFTITRNGDTTQGTFSPFSVGAGEWSNYFDGSTGYLTANPTALGSGNFTIEGFVYLTSSSINSKGIFHLATSTPLPSSVTGVALATGASGGWNLYYNNGSQNTSNTLTAVPNTWIHFAVVKESTQIRVYINGILNQSQTDTATYTNTATAIGGWYSTSLLMTGYVSNFRIVASALYSGTSTSVANFSIPTAPLTAISNTNFLTCQSNRFVDNSTANSGTGFAITRNGDVRVTPFSPFQPTQAYSPAVTGGSGYFDGNTDYLTVANTTALDLPGDFTVEFSVYLNSTADQTFIAKWAASNYAWAIQLFSGSLRFFPGNNGSITATSWSFSWSPTVSQWYSVALTRSGGSVRAYINGAQVGSTITETRNLTSTSLTSIGINLDGGGIQPVNGYVSNLRVLKGQALYTGATYTVPDAPLTTTGYGSTSQSITGTISLLLNFTNAGILDNTNKNVLETEGNAQIDTSIVKYGTGSMEFDGTGDFLVAPADQRNIEFLTGDFTIECWIRFSVVQNSQIITGLTAANTIYWQYFSSQLAFGQNNIANIAATNWSPSVNTWYHIAVTRSGTTVRQFVDGVQLGSNVTSSASFPNGPIQIGTGGGGSLNGYIDDLRITKGIARYTANFIPPIARMPNQ